MQTYLAKGWVVAPGSKVQKNKLTLLSDEYAAGILIITYVNL